MLQAGRVQMVGGFDSPCKVTLMAQTSILCYILADCCARRCVDFLNQFQVCSAAPDAPVVADRTYPVRSPVVHDDADQ